MRSTHAPVNPQATQETTQAHRTQALQPAHTSATHKEES
jgi:hypothetical protein